MWKGRFEKGTAEAVKSFTESVSFDRRLYAYDIQGSVAHVTMLAEIGVLSKAERDKIVKGLREIHAEIDRGEFNWDPALEDVHMNIESALIQRIGPVGAKLHTARSRNDQVALDLRLYIRAEIHELRECVRLLQRSLHGLARRHAKIFIPGYTHLQRAQPVPVAHHLLAYVEMLERDHERLSDSFRRVDVMPLGSGAIGGSTLPLNRELVAKLLDFPKVTQNSMDAVSDRDFAVETLFNCAMIGAHCSRLGEDLILWTSAEFGLLDIEDGYCTGSSLMPQKKNPDLAELARGKSGRLYGNLLSLLTVIKGLPLTYNRDLQEDKEPLFDSIDTAKAVLSVLAEMIEHSHIREERAAELVSDPLLLATDLTDYLVLKGVPFREAHQVVGQVVKQCEKEGRKLTELKPDQWKKHSACFGEDVAEALDLEKAMSKRTAAGAASLKNVQAQLRRWSRALGLA
ncbi:MAG: argininosuccinate lyase [Verrucomicrobiae bacterium]|nr:argininosuccinate lyase [Verrucomicrobiae bacterium]